MGRQRESGSRRRQPAPAIWVASAAVVLCLGVAYGLAAEARGLFPHGLLERLTVAVEARRDTAPPGRWRPARAVVGVTEEESNEAARIASLGYLRGVERAGSASGVTVYDRERACDGLNLFTSGRGPEAFLMDMSGAILHRWQCDFERVWPDWDESEGATGAEHWGFAHLLPDGDLLAIYNWFGVIRLDKDSNILWSHDGRTHHDLFVADDGSIYTLDTEPRDLPELNPDGPVADNAITILSPDGELAGRVSILDAFLRSDYVPLLERVRCRWDVLHTNTIEVLDGRLEHRCPAFRSGNVLLSFREMDTIAVVDMDTETVVWALCGRWQRQHQPTVLPNGRVLLFSNWAGPEASEVIEFDPFTQEVFWSYGGDADTGFFTEACGRNQRLSNGDTLITESDSGRAFEVAPDGTVVWEYVNPHRAGERGELIATIPLMVRLPGETPLEWLEAGGS